MGFHGNPATFNARKLEVPESNGTAVEPASLFEEQLKLRLPATPVSLEDLRQEWETLRDMPLPCESAVATKAIGPLSQVAPSRSTAVTTPPPSGSVGR